MITDSRGDPIDETARYCGYCKFRSPRTFTMVYRGGSRELLTRCCEESVVSGANLIEHLTSGAELKGLEA